MSARVVIFGTGSFAECVHFYLEHDSPHDVVAFTVSADALDARTFRGLPVVPFETIEQSHPPSDFEMFVAVGYRDLNRVRARLYAAAKAKGYTLVTYISSKATTWSGLEIGDNCFVFEDNTIQAFASLGSDVVLWSGNHIGHHAVVGDHCFITSHVVISGHVRVGQFSFVGVNATTRDSISIGESCIVGAGALLMRSTGDREVYTATRAKRDDRSSDEIDL